MRFSGILQVAEVRAVLRPYLQISTTFLLLLGLLGGWAGDNWALVLTIFALLIASIILIGRLARVHGPRPAYVYITAVVNLLAAGVIVVVTGGADSPFWLLFLIGIIASSLSLSGRAGNYLDLANVAVAAISMIIPELIAGRMTTMILTSVGMRIVTLAALGLMVRKVTTWVFEHGGALYESEIRLDLLINQIPAILWTTDTNLVFTSSLGLGLKALGLEPNQVVGMSLFEFFQTEDETFITIAAHRRALAGHAETYEQRWADNTYQSHVEPLYDVNGEISGAIGIAVDITHQKQTEEALRHSQRVESLGLLAGGVAHDFNNLLTAMLAQSSLALAKLPQENPGRPHVERAMKAAERAADLTHQLLAYSGRTPLQMRPVNLNVLIDENQHLFEVAIPKTVRLQANLTHPLPFVEADAGQMQQIIMNLILNAADAIGNRQGVVAISTDTVLVNSMDEPQPRNKERLLPGKYVKVSVRDDGVGMDTQTMARIFDPFFTTKSSGRGLGLAVVQGIAHSHKGHLGVDSIPGQGTVFRLLFPALTTVQENEEIAEETSPEIGAKGLVLVIDDEEHVRTAVTDTLEIAGITAVVAENGQAGIEIYRKRRSEIHLVLLDMSMPGLNGEETMLRLQRINPNVPVLLSSGYSQAEVSGRYREMGFLGFLQKPYEASKLLKIINQHLSQNA